MLVFFQNQWFIIFSPIVLKLRVNSKSRKQKIFTFKKLNKSKLNSKAVQVEFMLPSKIILNSDNANVFPLLQS